MIRLKEMRDDYYIFSKENFSIIGSRTKKKYSLGNKVKFKVVGGDVERKILDYTLI
jgi:exoribonuclease R